MPTITELVNIPTISDPTNFSAYADDFLANQLPNMVDELNAAFGGLTLISTTDTSASSVAIGLGAKTFIVTAGKSFYAGMPLTIADTAAPSTNAMYGTVTSYSGTSLVMDIKSLIGSGTKSAWSISLAGAGGATFGSNSFTGSQTLESGAAINESISTVASATTPDIWTATSNNINYTGTTTATGFAAAPQAGVRRTLILAAAASFTAGANMIIDGVVSFTGAAGDEVEVTAITTTQFRLRPKKYDGMALTVLSKIQPITASVAASALTITLNPTALDFRSSTLASGAVTKVTNTAAISLVISSGSTLGSVNAIATRLAILAINNAGTMELAAVNLAGGTQLDETNLITTVAEGGAGAADSATVVYSTTARTSVAYRVVGFLDYTQATAGTYATAPSTIQGVGGQALTALSSLGYGQTWQAVSRTSGTTYYNTTGKPIAFSFQINSNLSATITVNGLVMANNSGIAGNMFVIIPAGASYVVTTAAGMTVQTELR
jgi:hypothetical protein